MSFIYGLILIAMVWALSVLVDGITNIGAWFGSLPLWLTAIVLSSAIAWIVSDP
ncbi:MAG: hypothetical protein F6K00_32370 [Leptolyngbya sp. SIOISBB]|nr:hypothetical protein [Leptolyngbya sp. SIOISBB]